MARKGSDRGGVGRGRGQAGAAALRRAEEQIRDRLPVLLDNLFALADGVWIQKGSAEEHGQASPEPTYQGEGGQTHKAGRNGPVVYRTPPDRAANVYLIDRVMGKPTAKVEAEVEAGPKLAQTARVVAAATKELQAWREQMIGQLTRSSGVNAPEMQATPVITRASALT